MKGKEDDMVIKKKKTASVDAVDKAKSAAKNYDKAVKNLKSALKKLPKNDTSGNEKYGRCSCGRTAPFITYVQDTHKRNRSEAESCCIKCGAETFNYPRRVKK